MSGERPWLLSLALGLGAGLALVSTMWPDWAEREPELPEGAVARVDGEFVSVAEFDRAVTAVELDLDRELSSAEREEVREQLIDELLLVEHGLASGLPQRDPLLRTQIARAVLDGLRAEVETEAPPSEAELRAYFEAERGRFVRAGRIELTAAAPGGGGPVIPTGPLAPAKLRDYLGLELSEAVLALEPGDGPQTLEGPAGSWVIEVHSREDETTPSFDEVREAVARDFVRARTDAALGALLDELRTAAVIERSEP